MAGFITLYNTFLYMLLKCVRYDEANRQAQKKGSLFYFYRMFLENVCVDCAYTQIKYKYENYNKWTVRGISTCEIFVPLFVCVCVFVCDVNKNLFWNYQITSNLMIRRVCFVWILPIWIHGSTVQWRTHNLWGKDKIILKRNYRKCKTIYSMIDSTPGTYSGPPLKSFKQKKPKIRGYFLLIHTGYANIFAT